MTESAENAIQTMPVLPLRDIIVFPHMIVPLFVGREKSVRALEDVMKEDKQILLDARIGLGGEAAGIADGVLALGVHTQGGKNGAELGSLDTAREVSAVLRHARAVRAPWNHAPDRPRSRTRRSHRPARGVGVAHG